MNALVSVIIPCYNHGRFLPEALDSVLAQTYMDWEALIIDDGSTDETAQVATRYVECDARVRYHYQPNAGLAASRNAAIAAAHGTYLAFLDADDSWEPVFLETCLAALGDSSELAGVYSLYRFMDEHGVVFGEGVGIAASADEVRARLLRAGFFPPCTVLARADIVREVGAFDAGMDGRGTEDWDLWLRVTQRGRMANISEPLARYRVSSNSMSMDVERMHRNRVAVLSKYFGPSDGEPDTWPQERREAFAWAYQAAAVQYIAQCQPVEGWQKLAQAATLWTEILVQPETHYELACWDQSRGFRGQAGLLDLARNAALVMAGLKDLFAGADANVQGVRRAAYAQAYLALAMLADQAGQWGLARWYLLRGIGQYPRLLVRPGVARRFAKLAAGQRVSLLWKRAGAGVRDVR